MKVKKEFINGGLHCIEYKLPKDWEKWIHEAGLTYTRDSKKYDLNYFKGHGRYWRINCLGFFDMSEPYDTFDRWANSTENSFDLRSVNTKEEFINNIKAML